MKRSCDILVVGSGIIGLALAEHLTARELGKVLVIDKEPMPATGATGCSAGGIRQQFGDACKVRAAQQGYRVYRTFQERFGIDPGFHEHGYLIVRRDPAAAKKLAESVALQQELGLESRFFQPREISEIVPGLHTDDLCGAAFCRTDGYLDPHALVQGFLEAFKERGGEIEFEQKAEGLLLENGRVRGVALAGGEIEAARTVLACGPQTNRLLGTAGLGLPLRTCRRQIFSTGPVPGVAREWPLVLDLDAPFYFRPEGEGVIMSLAEVDEWDPPDRGNQIPLSRARLPELAAAASFRCPLLSEARIQSGWAGIRTLTPDERPLLGGFPGVERLFVAAGLSGHGITLAPFVARFIAREIEGDPLEETLRKPFLADRFAG